MVCCKKAKPPELERRIKCNDHDYNTSFEYANNHISTSKYNFFTFLPKNLFEQFQRLANAYFLGLLILQMIPAVSSLHPVTTVIPLVFVLTISGVKDAIDDFQRHRNDDTVNNRLSYKLRNGQLMEEKWHKVMVGDIIKLKNNEFVAADLLLLSSSEPSSLCYIETAELDGETNLKVKQALDDTAMLADNHTKMNQFSAEILCEPPNNRLSKFEGKLTMNGKDYSLDNEKILLRGCVLRNTAWCYGLVIFAGQDSKLMMNSGKTKFKRTHIDKLMNLLIIRIFLFLITMCLINTLACGVWETALGYDFQAFLPWEDFVNKNREQGAASIGALVFLSYIIILNTVVPISLYVSVEIIRLVNSLWINWDVKMYFEKNDTPAKARTTTLNEELGQIEYIFSDKTGTLTQNIMTFNKCSINRKMYGNPMDESGNPMEISERTPKVDFSGNSYAEESFDFYDPHLLEDVKQGVKEVELFFRNLALCHTVMPETKKDGRLEYQAQSPDEGALVSAARNFGFVFKARTPSTITIEVNGETEVLELLCILDFNNVRKRMSVIIKKDDKIMLFCKGADSVIFERLDSSCQQLKDVTLNHLTGFAQTGLRTLCIAYKELDPDVFQEWKKKQHIASTSMVDRDDKLDAVYEEIEKNLILIGATAIEDKLQDGVPETIANLAEAGIKIWVLTGDKQETAINIGYSCRLLTEEMEEPFIINSDSSEEVQKDLQTALDDLKALKRGTHESSIVIANGRTNGHIPDNTEECGEFAMVINGNSLAHALKPELEGLFLQLGLSCKAIICCRATPLQKALVVDLIKQHQKSITLAIGDGANDVSMIKTAHIGVGISGQEGMQAVLASDYALAQFRYLERLLLVHGRFSYLRMCKFLRYFFYKNFAFTLCHFWYALFNGFSAQTLYDPYFISLYNMFYTSLPVLVLAMLDQDVDDEHSIRYPKLYIPGIQDALFNKGKFLLSVGEGLVTSLILFFIPYGVFRYSHNSSGKDLGDIQSFGTVVSAILVVSTNIRCALDMCYWTGFNHFVIWGSIIYYFCFIVAFYSDGIGYSYVGVALTVFSSANFWLCLLLTCTMLIVPIVAFRFYKTNIIPTLADKVRLRQCMKKTEAGLRDLTIRRKSTMRRSVRSVRSGYAFAHQEGFGELITSGTNMRDRAQERSKSPVTLTKITRHNSTKPQQNNSEQPNSNINSNMNMNSNVNLNTNSNANSNANSNRNSDVNMNTNNMIVERL